MSPSARLSAIVPDARRQKAYRDRTAAAILAPVVHCPVFDISLLPRTLWSWDSWSANVSHPSDGWIRPLTYSIHRQGKAGIQNSVLSLESSSRLAIRVRRVCSTKGRLMVVQTYGSSSAPSFPLLLPLRVILPKIPFPAFPNPSAALVDVFLRLVIKWARAPEPSRMAAAAEMVSPWTGSRSMHPTEIVPCSFLIGGCRSADLFRMADPIISRNERSLSRCNGAVFRPPMSLLPSKHGNSSGTVMRIGVTSLGRRPPSSRRVDRVRLSSWPNRGLLFLNDSVAPWAGTLSDDVLTPAGGCPAVWLGANDTAWLLSTGPADGRVGPNLPHDDDSAPRLDLLTSGVDPDPLRIE